ncbi:uncharacterized protein LOC129239235 [Anastrepha obliqua]|uniref:uncharacterized protein LOC129239235 n=1 Tax=Anastrepha obliqua TaxID=95512 RepID=UPI002409EDBD|nr:uncharacterized protein LOC129239235 [Anastrepha obliqua]
MIFYKKQILLRFFLTLSVFNADGRRIDQLSYKKTYNFPLLRNMDYGTIIGTADDVDTGTGTGMNIDAGTGTGTGTGTVTGTGSGTGSAIDPDLENDTKPADSLVVIKPTQSKDSSRMFKGFLLRALLGPISGGSGNGYSGTPYIILNIPNNITNINQNNLTNTATTTTTTTTAAPATRILYQPLPFSSPQNYDQRGSDTENEELFQNFMLSPNNQLIPVYLPPGVETLIQDNVVRPGFGQRRRGQTNQNYNSKPVNPFSAFTNNLKRIQYW